MNKLFLALDAANTHELVIQRVSASNPSIARASPVTARPGDLANGIVIAEGTSIIVTVGSPIPPVTSTGLARVGKSEPGSMSAKAEQQEEAPAVTKRRTKKR